MKDFHLTRPLWLLALIPLVALIWALKRRHGGGDDWREHCDEALRPFILVGSTALRGSRPLWLAGLIGLLSIIALAGPAWERLPTPVFRNLSALVIVLDLSWAMEAEDLKPSRLERARYKIDDILQARKDGQTALVAYAGDAFVVTPLTDDVATILAQLGALSPRIMPAQGARMDLGLEMAGQLLQQAGQRSGDILLLTTGEGVSGGTPAAAHLHQAGYRVSALGVGTRDGAPMPMPQGGGFIKDDTGNIIITRLDVQPLWELTQEGGGLYHSLTSGSKDVDLVLAFLDHGAEAGQQSGQPVQVDHWREEGVWLLPLLLLLGALPFRRGWVAVLLLGLLLPLPDSAEALEWRDLWLTPDQQGQRFLDSGDAEGAAHHFRDPQWKAAAEYRAGHYDQAIRQLEDEDTAPAHYNRGNALARQNQLEKALEAYDRSLQLNPDDEDARYNRKVVEEALRQQQQQQQQQQQDSQSNQQDQEGEGSDSSPASAGEESSENPSEPEKREDAREDQPPKEPQSPDEHSSSDPKADHDKSPDGSEGGDSDSGSGSTPPDSDPSAQSPPQETGADEDSSGEEEESERDQAPGAEAEAGEDSDKPAPSDSPSEDEQAEAQWLRRIPDDPGGLLKRKFYYQYRQRQER